MKEKTTINQSRKQYNAIDLVKFMCSIMVVMIHIAPFGENSVGVVFNYGIQNCATRIGVPFFFVASGYFLYKKSSYDNFNIKHSKEYVMKILFFYIIWTIMYLPLRLKDIIENPRNLRFRTLSYIRDFLFVGSYKQLWYLNATIVGVVLISFLLYKKCKIKNVMILALFFYILGLLAQSWYGIIKPLRLYVPQIWKLLQLLQKIIITTRNGLFEGFLFIGIGMLFAFLKIEISMKKAVFGFVISYLLMFFEASFVKYFCLVKECDMYIFLVPTTFFMFYIAKNIKLKDNKIFLVLRHLSSLIFFMHLWVEIVISKCMLLLFDINIVKTSLDFIMTLGFTILGALVIIWLSKYKYFYWLKHLYM